MSFTIYNILPGLRSLRGRYLYLAVLLSLLLGASAIYGWMFVKDSSKQQIFNIRDRADASDAVNDVDQRARALESSLQRFIILPGKDHTAETKSALLLLSASLSRLKKVPWIDNDSVLLLLANDLSTTSDKLESTVNKLIIVRKDQMQWIPALKIMQKSMLLHNLEFTSALGIALDGVSGFDAGDKMQFEIYKQLAEVRHTWEQLITEFRLYISNRMGIYTGSPEAGMRVRAQNIAIYFTRINELLSHIEEYDSRGKLNFEASESLSVMKSSIKKWQVGYKQVNDILISGKWRADIILLNDSIDPLFSRFREQLSTLELELSVATAKDITQLTYIAKRLSDSVVTLAVAGIAFIFIAFLFFNRTLLIPIKHVSKALKAVAQGIKGARVPESSVEEVRDLTTAFIEMHKQVRNREKHLDHLAHHDPLTGLPNRILYHDRLDQALLHARRNKSLLCVMFLDLDNFKKINDSLGHEAGDLLLKDVAERLKSVLRKPDTVSRFGGDEFAILAENLTDINQIETIGRKINKKLSGLFQIGEHQFYVTTSIGITLCPQDANDADTLLKNADIAMYRAKELGRNRYQFYSQEMTTRISGRIEIEEQLRHALENDELDVYYQPIVDLKSGNIISAEALLRWQHPVRGLISAGEYINILDETGLIEPVTLLVMQKAYSCYRILSNSCETPISISVNLSGNLLRNIAFINKILYQFEQANMNPEHLIVEITEDTLLDDMRASDLVMETLSERGIRICMDDFGTRQSSLSHLRHAPIDIVKIDKDFIRDIPEDAGDSQLVAAIIAMSHNLGMKVVAEGVESSEQLHFLRTHKCNAYQGFLFSSPVPVEKIREILQEMRDRPAIERNRFTGQ